MEEIINRVMDKMSNINKPQRKFMMQLFTVFMTFVGKANFRNLSRYSALHEKTISRWFRVLFNYRDFNTKLLKSEVVEKQERIAALDASFINKSGKKTEGLANFWNGKNSKAEKGLEISLISVVDMESNTAFALEAKQTIDSEDNERDTKETRVDSYVQQVKESAQELFDLSISHLVVDAYYSKTKFINGVTSTGLELVGKLRIDADLAWIYNGPYAATGRKKKYGSKFSILKDLKSMEYVGKLDDGVEMYSSVLYAKRFKRKLKVVVLQWRNGDRVGHAILYSTDLELAAEKIVAYYKARFQIEFLFRDAKQHTGLTDCQSTMKDAIYNHVNASLTALNLLKIEDAREAEIKGPRIISIKSWKRKKFNQHYMKIVFDKLGLELRCKKVASVFDEMSDYGVIAA